MYYNTYIVPSYGSLTTLYAPHRASVLREPMHITVRREMANARGATLKELPNGAKVTPLHRHDIEACIIACIMFRSA